MTIARPASGAGPGVFGLLRELKMRLGSGFVLPLVSADGVVDRSRQMRHLRNALIHIGFDAADAEHYAFSAVVDSIDSVMGTIPAENPTDSLRGSEERVTAYMKRHERGEQLYHPRDNSQRIQIKCQH